MTDLSDISRLWLVAAPLLILAAALICAVLIRILHPLLMRYALARPNARSAHREPTPQGGGMAVIAATLIVAAAGLLVLSVQSASAFELFTLAAAVVLIALVGAADDIRAVAVVPRLVAQALTVGAVIAMLPDNVAFLSFLPFWLERLLLVVGGVWFVNLVNFMDGLDWMTVAEVVPLTAALSLLGMAGALPGHAVVVALALCGAMLGFAPFNKPVARLFLGDVGSLPIGLVLGWLLLALAAGGHLAAALLLPLYYLADATITLFRKLLRKERVWHAHRSHFYQRAMDRGMSVHAIVLPVFALNVALAMLAAATMLTESDVIKLLLSLAGVIAVASLLFRFERGKI